MSRPKRVALPPPFPRDTVDPLTLHLDAENPRLVDVLEPGKSISQDKLLRAVWDFGVTEIVTSIVASGFHSVEPLFVEKQPNGQLVVIEGNRRLCALQVLLDPQRAAKLGIQGVPSLRPEVRATCAAVQVVIGKREQVWAFIGTKHLNGPKTWDSAAKAAYIKLVHEEFKVPLDDVAAAIGDRNRTVVRMYESMKIFDLAEEWGVYKRSDSGRKHGDTPFSHLYTIAGYDSVRKHLGMAESNAEITEARSRAPIQKDERKKLGELLRWVYGHRGEGIDPVVLSQNPDLRNLAKAVGNKQGLISLRAGSSAEVAAENAEGDDVYVETHLARALEELELASKKFATGYTGQSAVTSLLGKIREVMRGLGVQALIKDNKEALE